MLFLLEWKIKEGNYEKAINRFINSNNNLEEGKIIEKYHSPGSLTGWVLVDTLAVSTINKYITEESEHLEWTNTPVLTDQNAQLGLSYQMKKK